jgi:hypothetical protein
MWGKIKHCFTPIDFSLVGGWLVVSQQLLSLWFLARIKCFA